MIRLTKFRGKDLTGNVYGRLTVVSFSYRDKRSNSFWRCDCICGKQSTVRIGDLNSGNTTSCGCYREEQSNKALIERSTTHGETGTRLYNIWRGIKQRCRYEKFIGYEYYGGRGIDVCNEWHDSYECFRDWALSNGYEDNLTIDRIDNDGNYEPSNCVWSTYLEQANNRRDNNVITHNGHSKTVSQWAEHLGVNKSTLGMRLQSGWSESETLDKPIGAYRS